MEKVHVKTGDTVMIISGKDRGNSGKVLQVSPKEGKVIVKAVIWSQSTSSPAVRASRAAS